jgi:hypothetical protein
MTGPLLVIFIATIVNKKTGDKSIIAGKDIRMSISLFIITLSASA